MEDSAKGTTTETAAPPQPQRNVTRLGRVLKPLKEKPAPRPWRGTLSASATAADYTVDDAGVTAEFVNAAIAQLSPDENERATLRLDPLSEEEREKAARMARFGQAPLAAGADKKPILIGTAPVDEVLAAKRQARFGTIPERKDNDLAAKHRKAQTGSHSNSTPPTKASQPNNSAAYKNHVASIISNIVNEETQKAVAARAARFGGATA